MPMWQHTSVSWRVFSGRLGLVWLGQKLYRINFLPPGQFITLERSTLVHVDSQSPLQCPPHWLILPFFQFSPCGFLSESAEYIFSMRWMLILYFENSSFHGTVSWSGRGRVESIFFLSGGGSGRVGSGRKSDGTDWSGQEKCQWIILWCSAPSENLSVYCRRRKWLGAIFRLRTIIDCVDNNQQ